MGRQKSPRMDAIAAAVQAGARSIDVARDFGVSPALVRMACKSRGVRSHNHDTCANCPNARQLRDRIADLETRLGLRK